MTLYNATIELDTRDTSDAVLDPLQELVEPYSGGVSNVTTTGKPGWVTLRVTYPAQDGDQAVATALGVAARSGHGWVALEVMTTAERDARDGFPPMPELLSITEAATLLGNSRQYVHQLLERGEIGGTRVGKAWVIPRSAVEARKGAKERKASAER